MPAEQKPVAVEPDANFVDYEGTKIQLPKPAAAMTQDDWIRFSSSPKSPLRRVVVDNQSFLGLHVKLKDPNWIPMWLYCARRGGEVPRAFDTMQRAINMGAQLVSTMDDIEQVTANYEIGADGHIHKDDVVLAKMPIVAYYAMQAQNIRRSQQAIEYQSVENKAYEGVDMPRTIAGNREAPLYEATEHSVQYQDRLRI